MMKFIFYFILIISVFACNFSKSNYIDQNNDCSNLKTDVYSTLSLIDTIARSYTTTSIELVHTLEERKQFIKLFNNPYCYKQGLIYLLSTDTLSLLKREIIVYGLQKLKIDEYVEVIDTCLVLYQEGIIDERLLINSISQVGFSREVIRNYNYPKLKKILIHIKNNNILKEKNNVGFIDDLIIGKIP